MQPLIILKKIATHILTKGLAAQPCKYITNKLGMSNMYSFTRGEYWRICAVITGLYNMYRLGFNSDFPFCTID